MYDDICALSTPYGEGALAVIRTSGKNAIFLVNQLFKGKDLTKVRTHTIHYGHLVYKEKIIDEVMISVFLAPKTFTKEDIVEITCHGGIFVCNYILQVLVEIGFRLATRGEFSKRAFLNGRIDLTQAEAIMDIIESENIESLNVSNKVLRKEVYYLIENLQKELLDIIAQIEVNIDYPEYEDVIELTNNLIYPPILNLIARIDEILEASAIGSCLVRGIKTVIIGKPNAGKSSLLNMMLEENKAIVSNIPGTTRDIVEGKLNLGFVTLNLADTAGIRTSTDILEKMGIEKSIEILNSAQLVLLVLDNEKGLDEDDYNLLKLTEDMPRIVIVNKDDIDGKIAKNENWIRISALEKRGLKELKDKIIKVMNLGLIRSDKINYLTNVRQISTLELAKTSLIGAMNGAINHLPIDLIEIDLKQAWNLLGEIIGSSGNDYLIDELFSKFCLGK